MRVGVLGSGVVGRTLATGFAEHGYDVLLGSDHPDKPEIAAWRTATPKNAAVGRFADAARHGELVVLACQGSAAEQVIELARVTNFDGKVVIDTTNPLDFSKGMPPGVFVGLDDSLGERVQRKLPRARVVKCFNIVPAPVMTAPLVHGAQPTMMIAGNDEAAKREVDRVLRAFGWTGSIDLGGIENARWLETLVPLWVRVAARLGDFGVAFRVLSKP